MKVYKVVTDDRGEKLTIYGSGRDIEIKTNLNGESYFNYRGSRRKLDTFMRTKENSWVSYPPSLKWIEEFDGINSDSFILIKLSKDGESLKAFTY